MPICKLSSKALRGFLRVAVTFSIALLLAEAPVSSQESKDVPLPDLPKNAGKADADAPKSFSTTSSGLKYRILRKGSGPKPKAADRVKVNYHGWLDSGKVFDSSYNRGEPISFGLNQVIKGWTEGMQLVGEGGMIELDIPFNLAYGAEGRPPTIPPRATLHFLVELLKVE